VGTHNEGTHVPQHITERHFSDLIHPTEKKSNNTALYTLPEKGIKKSEKGHSIQCEESLM
jgi:hypothetical protein